MLLHGQSTGFFHTVTGNGGCYAEDQVLNACSGCSFRSKREVIYALVFTPVLAAQDMNL